jgi:hypothetical protein
MDVPKSRLNNSAMSNALTPTRTIIIAHVKRIPLGQPSRDEEFMTQTRPRASQQYVNNDIVRIRRQDQLLVASITHASRQPLSTAEASELTKVL